MDYVSLRKEVIEAGLLDRQYGYYAWKIVTTLAMFTFVASLIFVVDNFWLQLLVVIGVAFWLMQIGLLGHDAGHQAIFKSRKHNDFFGHLFFDILVGMAYNYWVDRHGKHHANPNEEDDPDFPVFALTEEVLSRKKGFQNFISRRQHILFFLITGYFLFDLYKRGIMFNLKLRNCVEKWTELFLIGLHTLVFFIAPFFFFAWWKAFIFVFAVKFFWGVYFGSVVATNHKGMMVVKKGEELKLSFVEKQVLTTRNVRQGVIADFVYGGLNYQIEHHLFPTMPRNNFSKCKPLVVRFCNENNLPFEETGVIESYRQILGSLRRIALSAKT